MSKRLRNRAVNTPRRFATALACEQSKGSVPLCISLSEPEQTESVRLHGLHPRVQNSKELGEAAAAAGKATVTVMEPVQTSSAPELVLPGNVEANQMTSIYSRNVWNRVRLRLCMKG
jgi:hypothetical protein